MAAADGQFLEVETHLLIKIAKRNGLSEKDIDEVKQNRSAYSLTIPASRKERFYHFYDLVHMMIVDKLAHTDEMKLCYLFAIKFGYHRDIADELITSIVWCIENGKNADDTMATVSKYI